MLNSNKKENEYNFNEKNQQNKNKELLEIIKNKDLEKKSQKKQKIY